MAEEKRNPEARGRKRRGALDALRKVREIAALTQQEKTLILFVLLSIVCGKCLQHWRRVHAENPASSSASAGPFSSSKAFYNPRHKPSPADSPNGDDDP